MGFRCTEKAARRPNPEHIYAEPGSYTVSLTVSDGVNERTQTRENYINAITGNNISLSVASAEGYADIIVDIPVIVNSGFSDVGMLDLQLQYDTTTLHLVDIGSGVPVAGRYENTVEDRINAVWVYPGTALEIPDGDTLMLLHFRVDGSVMEDDHSPVSFSGNNHIAAPDESLLDLDLSNGVFSGLMTP
ncbi:MAG: PKD domain-containing protein [Candidatus Marinimicrobia bacterium]|nr:PKD domain-containing protein [Candidatus Neomarinimicrobiota bacterium]